MSVQKVVKRDGRIVRFDEQKITDAIMKAMADVNNCDAKLARSIAADIKNNYHEVMEIEDIQDLVERKLMDNGCHDAAKAYIIYRNDRSRARDRNSRIIKKVWDKLNMRDIVNANANVDEKSFSGREKEGSAELNKQLALDYMMSRDVADAHRNGLLYQHDLDKYVLGCHNCLQADMKELFENGFKTRNGDVRPPNNFSTACQLVAVIFQCQSQVCKCLTCL